MRVLLINNKTIRLKQTQEMLRNFEVETVNVWDLTEINLEHYDFIVLTGGNYASAFTRKDSYDVELELIKNSTIPIFGICLGMQLIVRVFSPVIFKKLEPQRRGVIKIKYHDQFLNVYDSHRWAIPYINSLFINEAESEDGVEIVKHKDKLIWGVQFHPEVDQEKGTNGHLIFNEFVSKIQPK